MYDWERELEALADLPDDEAAEAINAMNVTDSRYVFGSFRTLAAILSDIEYETLRNALDTLAAGSRKIKDMVTMLEIPGSEDGSGGGLDFANAGFSAQLTAICGMASLPAVPDKVEAYVGSLQPARPKYATVDGSMVGVARGTRPAVQVEVTNG